MSIAEHADRASHHRQPRRHVTHWGTDGTLHDGAEPSACETCRACPTCNGQGEVSPNTHVLARNPAALRLTTCGDCGGSGERGASRVHADPYCVTHCRPGIKHSQCGCPCDHRDGAA